MFDVGDKVRLNARGAEALGDLSKKGAWVTISGRVYQGYPTGANGVTPYDYYLNEFRGIFYSDEIEAV